MTKATDRGMLLLDKPEDLTSMQCVEISKRLLNARKAGHSGTLDPKVTGLMLIAFNEATKAMPVLIGLGKEYEGVMRIHGPFTRQELARAVKAHTGSITQTPPRRSAVVRKPRKREVYSFEVLSVEGRDVRFRASCEAGTYIRKLCHDVGEALGRGPVTTRTGPGQGNQSSGPSRTGPGPSRTGAHMASLRRTGIGPFSIDEAFTMDQLRSRGEECLFPLEEALERLEFPMFSVPAEALQKLRNGVPIGKSELSGVPQASTFGILDSRGRLSALASSSIDEEETVKPERIFN